MHNGIRCATSLASADALLGAMAKDLAPALSSLGLGSLASETPDLELMAADHLGLQPRADKNKQPRTKHKHTRHRTAKKDLAPVLAPQPAARAAARGL